MLSAKCGNDGKTAIGMICMGSPCPALALIRLLMTILHNMFHRCLYFWFQIPSENQATWYKLIDQNGRYLCQFCNLTYSTVQTLRHHIKIKHPENAKQLKNQILNNKRNRKLKCHICKTRFKELKILKEHVKRTHELENLQISCKNCDATFSSKKEMAEHLFHKHKIKEHKLFSCLTCGYRTSKKSHFRQHKNTHSELKLLKCQFCEYSTNYLPNLNIHVRIHTNQKPYKCDFKECSYNCAAKSALRSHQLKHNRDDNFLYCDKCSYKTVYKQSLKKHIESHQRNSIRLKF